MWFVRTFTTTICAFVSHATQLFSNGWLSPSVKRISKSAPQLVGTSEGILASLQLYLKVYSARFCLPSCANNQVVDGLEQD
jgi:hypothetical protein